MTPATPPEKMMLEDAQMVTQLLGFADHLEAAGRDMDGEFLRSVARRLAPRVGDDAMREALLLYIHWGTLHENSECPEDDTCTCYVARTVNAALSASPAASADERLDLAQAINPTAWSAERQISDGTQTWELLREHSLEIADDLLSAGYRKRAAQHEAPGDYEAQRVLSAERPRA